VPESGKRDWSLPDHLTEAGQQHPLFSHFGSPLTVGHWHNDMPGLTDQATILATSEGCPRQIVQYGNFVYGFQCHMEFTADAMKGLFNTPNKNWRKLKASASSAPLKRCAHGIISR
jgi:GMP synthase-like glutamine amidotransferase